MPKTSFALETKAAESITSAPVPDGGYTGNDAIAVPMDGRIPTVALGRYVSKGQTIGLHPSGDKGHATASVDGKVAGVSLDYVVISAEDIPEDKAEEATPPEPVDLASLEGKALTEALRELGIDPGRFAPARHLIVNGVSPEPLLNVHATLLAHASATLNKGLDLARRLVEPESVAVAIPAGSEHGFSSVDTVFVKPVHPMGADPLVVREVLRTESMDEVRVVGVPDLYALGTVAETGLPRTEIVACVGSTCYLAPVGIPAGILLDAQGVTPAQGDKLIIGGPMRGTAAYSARQGMGPSDLGVMVVPRGSFPPVTDNPCINCGDCVLACPARLMPNFLSRYAEFGMYEDAENADIHACFECGMCGYACPVGRPMLQYIRFAKSELACRKAMEGSCDVRADQA